MNVNPLAETQPDSKADAEDEPKDVDALYSKPDPEVVKSKKLNKTKAKSENATAVVNEFFDEEEPDGDDKSPTPPPVEPMTIEDTNEETNNDKPTGNNTTDVEPLVQIEDATQKESIVSVDEDKAAEDIQPSPTTKTAPANENEDDTTEAHTNKVNEEQMLVTEQEEVLTNNKEVEGEATGIKEDADNIPLIDIKRSATKNRPSSPGKYGLKVKLPYQPTLHAYVHSSHYVLSSYSRLRERNTEASLLLIRTHRVELVKS